MTQQELFNRIEAHEEGSYTELRGNILKYVNTNAKDISSVAQFILDNDNKTESYKIILSAIPYIPYRLQKEADMFFGKLGLSFSVDWAKSPNAVYEHIFNQILFFGDTDALYELVQNKALSTQQRYFALRGLDGVLQNDKNRLSEYAKKAEVTRLNSDKGDRL